MKSCVLKKEIAVRKLLQEFIDSRVLYDEPESSDVKDINDTEGHDRDYVRHNE